ncbi:hypothetical protein HMPREF0542_11057, partial [Ligilactobacillus ruminis ATCC 25644]
NCQGNLFEVRRGAPLTAPSRVLVHRHGCNGIPCTTSAREKK